MPRSQMLTAVILGGVVTVVLLVFLALIDFSLFFIVLTLLLAGVIVLRMKKPEVFSVFARKKKTEEAAPGEDGPKGIKRDQFTAHLILLYQGSVTNQQISVDQPEFKIGRSASCNFVLTDNTDISRVHAIIRYNESTGQSAIIDNNSTHGTKLNGEWLAPGVARTLHSGDMIQIEDRVITVQSKFY